MDDRQPAYSGRNLSGCELSCRVSSTVRAEFLAKVGLVEEEADECGCRRIGQEPAWRRRRRALMKEANDDGDLCLP
jgi:hypothetical protein